MEDEGRRRVVIEGVTPQIDCGLFPVKRTVGEKVTVEADIYTDGFDAISAVLRYRQEGDGEWSDSVMEHLVNDRWRGVFVVEQGGQYSYAVMGWLDRFNTWRRNIMEKMQARQNLAADLLVMADIIERAARRAPELDAGVMNGWAQALRATGSPVSTRARLALSGQVAGMMAKYPDRTLATTSKELPVWAERERACFGAWYEMYPRSASPEPGRYGTFQDCQARLPYIADMAFDVLYLPPIHPIGRTNRKGKNNTTKAGPDDPGSLWAIGNEAGGHKAVHPEMGTLADFRELVDAAKNFGIEIALDIAFHTSPDHPYVKEHPEWYFWLPDGALRLAENPPNRYEDITFFNFETEKWQELRNELKDIFLFWIQQGVRIFRVDNPHTKPFPFWQWVIPLIKKDYPEVIFLAEAFTRPKLMYRLSKAGFTQSYTYFEWRNTKFEITQYLTELTQTGLTEFFNPNLWPNTPDNLTPYFQNGGRPAFMARLVLAATLSASYGIYGPAFELCERRVRVGSEEYLNSETYEIKNWNINRPDSLKDFIGRVNRIRRENPALHRNLSLRFHDTDNEQLICYSKRTENLSNIILVVVNLDPHHINWGLTNLSLDILGLKPDQGYQAHDLLDDARYQWHGARNYIELNPDVVPAHIFRIET